MAAKLLAMASESDCAGPASFPGDNAFGQIPFPLDKDPRKLCPAEANHWPIQVRASCTLSRVSGKEGSFPAGSVKTWAGLQHCMLCMQAPFLPSREMPEEGKAAWRQLQEPSTVLHGLSTACLPGWAPAKDVAGLF